MSAEWLLRSLLQVCGAVAQLVARLVRIEKVRGSIPLSSTKAALLEPWPTKAQPSRSAPVRSSVQAPRRRGAAVVPAPVIPGAALPALQAVAAPVVGPAALLRLDEVAQARCEVVVADQRRVSHVEVELKKMTLVRACFTPIRQLPREISCPQNGRCGVRLQGDWLVRCQGPGSQGGPRVLEHATASLLSNGAAEPAPLLRLEQRAPRRRRRGHGRSAVGLRPIADPDASSRRAHMQAKDAKGKINTSLTSLDQPRSWNDL